MVSFWGKRGFSMMRWIGSRGFEYARIDGMLLRLWKGDLTVVASRLGSEWGYLVKKGFW